MRAQSPKHTLAESLSADPELWVRAFPKTRGEIAPSFCARHREAAQSSQHRASGVPNVYRILLTDETVDDFSDRVGEGGSEFAVDRTNTVYPSSEKLRAAARPRPA